MRAFIQKHWRQLIFLAVLVIITYLNGLGSAFVSDDLRVIPQNQNLTNMHFIFSNPLSSLRLILYVLAFKIGGLNPVYYRLINVFFHIGSVLVVYILLTYLSNIHKNFVKRPVPLLAAAIFAVHPILVESVTWISGGSYSQNGFFLLATFLLYVLSKHIKGGYIMSLISYLFILGSAPHAIVLPAVLALYEFSFGKMALHFKKIIPFVSLLAILAIGYFFQLNQRVTALATDYSPAKGIDNIFIKIPLAITTYLQLIFWPDKLAFYHSDFVISSIEFTVRLVLFLFYIIIILLSFKKNRMIFFWLSFFLLTLLPTLTPLPIAWIVAERYVYLGSLGIFISTLLLFQNNFEEKRYRLTAYSIFVIIMILLFSRTVVRNIDWKNEDNLWFATAKTAPYNPVSHNNLGDVYTRHGSLKKAAEEFTLAIKLDPNYFNAYHNLALIYEQMGKIDLALEYYQEAVMLNPNLWQSYQNIAVIHYRLNRYEKAYEFMKKAIKISPQNGDLFVNLGIMYLQQRKKTEAKYAFEQALHIDPKNPKAQAGLENTK